MPVGPLDTFIADLGGVPAEVRKQMRPALKRAAEPILRDARSRAAWSTRIPRSLRIQVTSGVRKSGVRLVADPKVAPHARPFENGSQRSRGVRHPVFGHRDRWVTQPARPFFWPAINAGQGVVNAEVASVVDATARAIGFKRRS